MSDGPEDYGLITVESGEYAVTMETMAAIRERIAARDEWIDFDTLFGAVVRIRTVRIESTGFTSRDSRMRHRLFRQHQQQEEKEDVPDWEAAD